MTATMAGPWLEKLDEQLEQGAVADAYDEYELRETEAWERYVADPSSTEAHAYLSIERLLRHRRDRKIAGARAR